jgi:RNA polymerase sigma-70 factor (ECF subfamily)
MEPVHERACAFARGLARSRADGDDLFQASVLRAYERVDTLQDEGAFRTWLYRIVVSVHRNHLRSAWWRRWSPFRDEQLEREAHYREADRAPESAASVKRARAALAKLPAAQREAIVMFEIEGMSVDEIADVQGVSASAVKSRLARGRERLRAHYERAAARAAIPEPMPNGDSA